MEKNGKIFILTHKDKIKYQYLDNYIPLQIGKDNNVDINLNYLTDNTGDNISIYNKDYYAEYTGLYWVWKNYKNIDYVGFFHYRRLLLNPINNLLLNNEDIIKLLQYHDFILPPPFIFKGLTASEAYLTNKNSKIKDLFLINEVLKDMSIENYNEDILYKRCFYYGGHYCNIFICSWEEFNKYMEFVFTFFDKFIEKYKNNNLLITDRKLGYIGEFLIDIYMNIYNKKYIEVNGLLPDNYLYTPKHPMIVVKN